MLISPKKYFLKSRQQKFAIPAFNIYNLETVLGVLRAAKKLKSPVIIAVSESNIRYSGLNAIYSTIEGIIKDIDKDLPVILHLDHGSDFNLIKDCISVGFNSIQIDASKYNLSKNIQITKEVVDYAHKYKIFVEGELGAMQGGHGLVSGFFKGKIPLADINEVKRYVKETNIDSLAPAVGTVHGMFKNEKIDFNLLKQIRMTTGTYLVLHGASGVRASQIMKAVRLGINKVNIGTEIKVAFTNTIRETSLKNKNETDPRKILIPAIDRVEQVALKVIKILNSQNKI